jgi:hypothetical protein
MHVADVAHLRAPHRGAEHRRARPEVRQRVRWPALGESQPSLNGRDQHGPDTRRPSLPREKLEQRLRFVELVRLDRDIRQHGRRERQPRREIAFLQHAQSNPRGRIGLRQRPETEPQQAQCALDRDKPPRFRSG